VMWCNPFLKKSLLARPLKIDLRRPGRRSAFVSLFVSRVSGIEANPGQSGRKCQELLGM
jgi:hypothetical protein